MSTLLDSIELPQVIDGLVRGGDPPAAHPAQSFFGEVAGWIRGAVQEVLPEPSGPTVVIIPGYMGNDIFNVAVTPPEKLWLKFQAEPVARLALDDQGGDQPGLSLVLGDIFAQLYAPMIAYLNAVAGLRTRTFPYDFRRSLDVSAQRLADLCATIPGRVAFVGHSAGALVARRAVHLRPELLEQLDHAVYLAPPFHGSYRTLCVLAGTEPIVLLGRPLLGLPYQAVFKTFPSFAEQSPDPAMFPDAAEVLQQPWCDHAFSPAVLAQGFAFHDRLRAAYASSVDAELLARSSTILTRWIPTKSRVEFEGSTLAFPAWEWGDGTVPVRAGWDPQPNRPWEARFEHTFVELEPAVIAAVASLIRTNGAVGGPLAQFDPTPYGAASAPAAPPPPPEGHAERLAAKALTLADVRWSAGDHAEVALPAPR